MASGCTINTVLKMLRQEFILSIMLETQEIHSVSNDLVRASKTFSSPIVENRGFVDKADSAKQSIDTILKDIEIGCSNVLKILSKVEIILENNKGWDSKKNDVFSNVRNSMSLMAGLVASNINLIQATIPESNALEQLISLSEKLEDVIDHFEIVIAFYNKEPGNDLQVALDRLNDEDDPIVPFV